MVWWGCGKEKRRAPKGRAVKAYCGFWQLVLLDRNGDPEQSGDLVLCLRGVADEGVDTGGEPLGTHDDPVAGVIPSVLTVVVVDVVHHENVCLFGILRDYHGTTFKQICDLVGVPDTLHLFARIKKDHQFLHDFR